jgi:hypothetical protein
VNRGYRCGWHRREQLKDRQRFIVVSLGQRLLVFLPTAEGELLLLLPRDAENTDDLVQEVVQSVMRVSAVGRACPGFEDKLAACLHAYWWCD